ncbi:MAG: ABC transporter permease [candidate division Zixibacteria bacterium]|nr:ABC transporter permease [candidate division Zixibacteria bacterium]
MGKIVTIAVKEVRHILRDRRSLFIALMMPVLMTLLYGYAVNLDINNIKLAVLDYDNSSESRELINRFYHSGYFIQSQSRPELSDPEKVLKLTDAIAVMIIRPGFSKAVIDRSEFQVGMLIDGADANMSSAASSYSAVIFNQFLISQMPPETVIPGVTLSLQVLYNPDLKSSHFFVPGLVAVILMMISALLTSITIAREKETGTMEQLLTSPVTPRQIIMGKVIPYIGLAILDGVFVYVFAVWHFGVPMIGSAVLLLIIGVIYIIASLSLGVLISTLVNTQQLAMMAALTATMLPSVMLSGFIFEIKNMPAVLQVITHAIPARYFIQVIRGIMLKGAGLEVLWPQAVALMIITLILLGLAAKKFKIKIG